MMCYYLNVHFQGQTAKVVTGAAQIIQAWTVMTHRQDAPTAWWRETKKIQIKM